MTEFSYQTWRENPFRLVSLMELLRLNAGAFCRLTNLLGQLAFRGPIRNALPLQKEIEDLVQLVEIDIVSESEKLGLRSVVQQLKRISQYSGSSPGASEKLQEFYRELYRRIEDELETNVFLGVPFGKASYYEQKEPLFGPDVIAKFSARISEDVSEAGKCFALNRYTATVFHLMRVMEAALQAFGTKLGIALTANKYWQNILDEVDKAIKSMDHKLPLTKSYAGIAAHLYAVKVAWRNEVMHPKETYTEEEAGDIIRNVKAFMVNLAQVM
jgi:hypothetical protein